MLLRNAGGRNHGGVFCYITFCRGGSNGRGGRRAITGVLGVPSDGRGSANGHRFLDNGIQRGNLYFAVMSFAAEIALRHIADELRMGRPVTPSALHAHAMGDMIIAGMHAVDECYRDHDELCDATADRNDAFTERDGLRVEVEELNNALFDIRAELVSFGALAAEDTDTNLAAVLAVLLA
jgi:hypothetical protein